MNRKTRLAAVCAVLLAGSTASILGQGYAFGYGPQQPGYGAPPAPQQQPGYGHRDGDHWDEDHRDGDRDRDSRNGETFREIQERGFRDGMDGARHDVENRRYPNVNNRDEYRHPRVPDFLRHEYRESFERGYGEGMEHLMRERSWR